MPLDTSTLRVAFGVVALIQLVLFYLVTFRRTRSAYSAWWCAAIGLFLAGSAAFLLDGTSHQVWANPLGNTLLVAGAAAVWAAARSLHRGRPRVAQLAAPPLLTALASAADSPAVNAWSGGPVFLAMMSLLFGLGALEVWRPVPHRVRTQVPLAVASGFLSLFYLGRGIAFVVDGVDGFVFTTYFGSAVTTLITLTLLVVVSFTMAALSNDQVTRDLRHKAARDGLTGLLNRSAFLDRADRELKRLTAAGIPGALILADLDRFKQVNDTYGHAAGDTALRAFAEACSRSVRSTDLVGRYGGEEFIILLAGADGERAEAVSAEISRVLQGTPTADGFPLPTVSYGIADAGAAGHGLEAVIASADAALYAAKSQGRNRAVRAAA
ncbi:GGDEF domain-containing protein [Arthrobacter sp. MSA 4-2]|uniref:GGDEF domain-containing protein n=1 Tax=Arthrobacter sp. MSA 4-2 TaxID=2794349 RepID=UPI0018E6E736|nr:GGDEF domain-containing protein [Arthrobacter sp. MSA 4-2]MBJ2121290.1 GGDEF domain-containing protein [Arthrobacter sp. MSA 4-2]